MNPRTLKLKEELDYWIDKRVEKIFLQRLWGQEIRRRHRALKQEVNIRGEYCLYNPDLPLPENVDPTSDYIHQKILETQWKLSSILWELRGIPINSIAERNERDEEILFLEALLEEIEYFEPPDGLNSCDIFPGHKEKYPHRYDPSIPPPAIPGTTPAQVEANGPAHQPGESKQKLNLDEEQKKCKRAYDLQQEFGSREWIRHAVPELFGIPRRAGYESRWDSAAKQASRLAQRWLENYKHNFDRINYEYAMSDDETIRNRLRSGD